MSAPFGAGPLRIITADERLREARGIKGVLTGTSGIGKTTLARIVAGLDRDFDGTLEVPERLAMVFQEPTLLPWRSAAFTSGMPASGLSRP